MALNLLLSLMLVFLQCWKPSCSLQAHTVYVAVGSTVNLSVPQTCPDCFDVTWFWKPQHNCSEGAKRFQLAVSAPNSSKKPLDPQLCSLQKRLQILADYKVRIEGVEFTDAGNFTCEQKRNESIIDTVFQLVTVKVGAEPSGPAVEGQTVTLFCRVSWALSAPAILWRDSADISHPTNTNQSRTTTVLTVRNITPGERQWKCVIDNGKYTVEYQLMVIALPSGLGQLAALRISCLLLFFFFLLAGYAGYQTCKRSRRQATLCIQLEAFMRRHSLLREELES